MGAIYNKLTLAFSSNNYIFLGKISLRIVVKDFPSLQYKFSFILEQTKIGDVKKSMPDSVAMPAMPAEPADGDSGMRRKRRDDVEATSQGQCRDVEIPATKRIDGDGITHFNTTFFITISNKQVILCQK